MVNDKALSLLMLSMRYLDIVSYVVLAYLLLIFSLLELALGVLFDHDGGIYVLQTNERFNHIKSYLLSLIFNLA